MHESDFSNPGMGLFPDHLFEDTNGDGYPDRLAMEIRYEEGMDHLPVWAGILNLTARLAFHVTSLDLPLVVADKRLRGDFPLNDGRKKTTGEANRSDVSILLVHRAKDDFPHLARIARSGARRFAVQGNSPEAMGRLLDAAAVHEPGETGGIRDWQEIILLKNGRQAIVSGAGGNFVWALGGSGEEFPGACSDAGHLAGFDDLLGIYPVMFQKAGDEPRSNVLNFRLCLGAERISGKVGEALTELVAGCVLESTDITLPLVTVVGNDGGTSRGNNPVCLTVTEDEGAAGLGFAGDAQIAARGESEGLSRLLRSWARLLLGSPVNGDSRARTVLSKIDEVKEALGGSCGTGIWARRLYNAAGRGTGVLLKGRPLGGRVTAACDALKVPYARKRSGEGILRRRVTWTDEVERIQAVMEKIPEGEGEIFGTILVSRPREKRECLRNEWAKLLAAKGYVPEIRVLNAYKPGLGWLMEVILPMLKAGKGAVSAEMLFKPFNGCEEQLEMKSRWLQEAFPGPDILAAQMNWEPDRISLGCDEGLSSAYCFRAWDSAGNMLFEERFTPMVHKMPLFTRRPEQGSTHPACSAVCLTGAAEVLEKIPTDRQAFWEILQERWLPELEAFMDERRESLVTSGSPAFWSQIAVDVAVDETDLRLGLDEERVCPMEALHEDLYFGFLEFFRLYAKAHDLPQGLQLGLVLPRVSADTGNGRPHAALRAVPMEIEAAGKPADGPAKPRISAMSLEKNEPVFHLEEGPGRAFEDRELLLEVVRALGLPLYGGEDGLVIKPGLPRRKSRDQAYPFVSPEPPLDRYINFEETGDYLSGMARMPHLSLYRGGESIQGRPIPVLEAVLKKHGRHSSAARDRLLKPTLLINARHHANEISSTNAMLNLAWRLGASEEGQRLLEGVNVVFIPMENADGVATFEKLIPGCRDHKLHAARYNAWGVEWYGDYHAQTPRFPEARVKAALWDRWLPRYMLDAHGVPSHEWDQPFAGYVNARFREHWIPRAFVYAILPFLDDPEHPGRARALALADRMADRMGAKADIQAANRRITDRYNRYTQGFEGGTFKKAEAARMLVVPTCDRIDPENFARRKWPVTELEVITEVVDEVASGKWLKDCADAHMTVAEAMIEELGSAPRASVQTRRGDGRRLHLCWRAPNAGSSIQG